MLDLNPGLIFFLTALGLAFGSFSSAVIYRVPRNLSLGGRSKCPDCSHQLSPKLLIPIFSWIFYRGKCHYCKSRISLLYPLTELLCCAGIWLAFMASSGDLLKFTATAIFVLFGISLSSIDIKTFTLPNSIVYLQFVLLLIVISAKSITTSSFTPLLTGLEGALIASAFYLALHLLTGGMGMGDVKLSLSVGLMAGFYKINWILVSTYLSFLLGALFSAYLIFFKSGGRKTKVPFGPFIISGSILGFFLTNPISTWLTNLFN